MFQRGGQLHRRHVLEAGQDDGPLLRGDSADSHQVDAVSRRLCARDGTDGGRLRPRKVDCHDRLSGQAGGAARGDEPARWSESSLRGS